LCGGEPGRLCRRRPRGYALGLWLLHPAEGGVLCGEEPGRFVGDGLGHLSSAFGCSTPRKGCSGRRRRGCRAARKRQNRAMRGSCVGRRLKSIVLCRPGSDLLSQVLRHSTIGAEEFNGRVRDGIGFRLLATATRPAKDNRSKLDFLIQSMTHPRREGMGHESVQAYRTISTGKLHTLLCFHTRPINVVVYHGSQGRPRLEASFPLRCIQRLSFPHIATLHCRWRDNSSTRGVSIPVLSY
jgi:hypothetical protein